MINSIKHFEEKSIPVFEKLEGNFYRNPTDVASFVTGLAEELHQLGLLMIKETLEDMNLMLKESGKRVQNWVVEKDVEKQLLTSLEWYSIQRRCSLTRKPERWSICWTGLWDLKRIRE